MAVVSDPGSWGLNFLPGNSFEVFEPGPAQPAPSHVSQGDQGDQGNEGDSGCSKNDVFENLFSPGEKLQFPGKW